jgi:mono/diheme cytochrome c family protein
MPVKILGADGFLNESHPLHSLAMDGVSCAVCHQISPTNLGQQSSFSGGYVIDTSTVAPDRLIYGPFANPFINQMRNTLGFTPVLGNHTTQSELCGTCHNLETPFVDAAGTVVGTFPEQMTYSEWEHSRFNAPPPEGRECQQCHMPAANGGVVLSNRGGPGLNLQPRSPFTQHHFVGGNEFMLKLMSANLNELQLTASTQQIEDTRIRLISRMQSATASLAVTGVRTGTGDLEIGLIVNNLVGHKFPSGFPSRRAWIHFRMTDGNGDPILESGRPAAFGRIEGNDADYTPGGCEPHRRLVSSTDEVQIYESVMENTEGEVTYTLLRGAAYRKDNRLLPQGFDRATADPRIAVAGQAADDPDFIGGSDEVAYRVATSGRPGPYRVDVKLLYQSVSGAFATDLRNDDTAEVRRYMTMHDAADPTPVTVASLQFSLDPADFFHLALEPSSMQNGPDLTITGPAGGTVDLEISDDLGHWSILDTFTPPTVPFIYEDSSAIGVPKRFYRLSWPLAPSAEQ